MNDDDHLRDDPSLPGGPEWDGGVDEEAIEDRPRTSWLRPLMMNAVERWDFELGEGW